MPPWNKYAASDGPWAKYGGAAPPSKAKADAEKRRGPNDFMTQQIRDISLGAQDLTNAGFGALVSQAPRLIGRNPGYGLGEAFNAAREVEGERGDAYSREKPMRSLGAGLLGGLAMPGGKVLAKAAMPAAKGLLGGLEAVGRGAGIGGALGGVYGASTAKPGDELGGAGRGAITGAITGGAVPVAGAALGAAGRGAGSVGRTVVRAANKASGGQLLDPAREAGIRLVQAMRKDKLAPETIRQVQAQWLKTGVTPTLLDMVSAGGGGQNTRALLRGSAMEGAGRNEATQYAGRVGADLQDNAIDLTRKLTPDTRSAGELRTALEAERGATADRLYPQFQNDQVPVEAFGDALSGATGRKALGDAYRIADARRDTNATAEITAMLNGEAQQISAGTADLIRRGLRDAGQDAARNSRNTLGGGLTGRAADLEGALTGVPGFDEARNAFRSHSQAIDAIDLGATGPRAAPDEFDAAFGALPENAVSPGQVGYRQALTDQIGAAPEGALGALNRIGTSTNQGRNLATAFGEEPAETYRQGVTNLADQARNARFIDPGTNSQTAGRLMDADALSVPQMPRGVLGLVSSIVDKIRQGATLTDQERQAIVQLGIANQLPDDLALLLQQQARQHAMGSRLAPALSLTAAGQ